MSSLPPQTLSYRGGLTRGPATASSPLTSPSVVLAVVAAIAAGAAVGYHLAVRAFKPTSRITNKPLVSNKELEVIHVYEDEQGESHFGVFTVPLTDQGLIGSISQSIPSAPATGNFFRFTHSSYHYPPHCAPRRQFIFHLNAGVRITTSDGDCREIMPGQVQFVSDISGKGHVSESINSSDRYSVFMSVADDYQPPVTTPLLRA